MRNYLLATFGVVFAIIVISGGWIIYTQTDWLGNSSVELVITNQSQRYHAELNNQAKLDEILEEFAPQLQQAKVKRLQLVLVDTPRWYQVVNPENGQLMASYDFELVERELNIYIHFVNFDSVGIDPSALDRNIFADTVLMYGMVNDYSGHNQLQQRQEEYADQFTLINTVYPETLIHISDI